MSWGVGEGSWVCTALSPQGATEASSAPLLVHRVQQGPHSTLQALYQSICVSLSS